MKRCTQRLVIVNPKHEIRDTGDCVLDEGHPLPHESDGTGEMEGPWLWRVIEDCTKPHEIPGELL